MLEIRNKNSTPNTQQNYKKNHMADPAVSNSGPVILKLRFPEIFPVS